jgi:hypothetical protein
LNRSLIGQLSLDHKNIALAAKKLADCLGLECARLALVDATKAALAPSLSTSVGSRLT